MKTTITTPTYGVFAAQISGNSIMNELLELLKIDKNAVQKAIIEFDTSGEHIAYKGKTGIYLNEMHINVTEKDINEAIKNIIYRQLPQYELLHWLPDINLNENKILFPFQNAIFQAIIAETNGINDNTIEALNQIKKITDLFDYLEYDLQNALEGSHKQCSDYLERLINLIIQKKDYEKIEFLIFDLGWGKLGGQRQARRSIAQSFIQSLSPPISPQERDLMQKILNDHFFIADHQKTRLHRQFLL